MPPNDFSQPGPSQNTDSQDTHKRDEECKQQNHDQKEANNRNDNKTKKAVNTKKMTYRVVEVNDPAMIAQIQCLKILKSLGAEIPPNVVNFLDLDETRKIFVIEAEDSSNESDQNSTTHDTDQVCHSYEIGKKSIKSKLWITSKK